MRKVRFLIAVLVIAVLAIAGMQNNSTATVKVFQKGAKEELKLAESLSFSYLKQHIADYGIDDIKDLKVLHVFIDETSMAHTRLQQTFQGVPVFNGQIIVHLNSDGSIFTVTDSLVNGLQLNTRPDLSASKAVNKAIAEYGCEGCLTSAPNVDMLVMRRKNRDRLVYRVQLHREDGSPDTAMPVYFIDAHTGKTVFSYDNLQTQSTVGTGVSLYSGTVSINTFRDSSGTYYMEDLTRKIGTFDNANSTGTSIGSGLFRFTDADNLWYSATQQAGVDAHYGTAKVYDYYLNIHGRNGIDGVGGPASFVSADGVTGLISSRVHYSINYKNAFWNGSYMTYGDGDGITFLPFTTLDIAGHEVTHGVTERTAALDYFDESGALNESMSDVFGAMVERYVRGESANTWLNGEDAYTPGIPGDAFRYMDDPHRASEKGYTANDDPDHYSERFLGTADNGGVHINSGIANKAFYLLAKGGTHHLGGSMTGIGADAAAKIWYKALTTYMTSSTGFGDAVFATLNAAAQLYGTGANYNAVAQAWSLCGVCGFALSPSAPQFFPGSGGSGTFTVTSTSDCSWVPVSSVPWIRVTSGGGSGNGTVSFVVDPNPTTFPRLLGKIAVGYKTFVISQAGAPEGCTYAIAPANSIVLPASGGGGSVSVTAPGGCGWAAYNVDPFNSTVVPWVHITSSNGNGNGTATYTVDPHTGAFNRSALITVAGKPFGVNQSGTNPCYDYSISPTSKSFTASGGSGTVSVTTSASCSWTATESVSWIQITSGSSGTGNGTVSYVVDPKTGGGSRVYTMIIAGKSFTVSQK
jgi:Zn-dependent metalloprotease